MVLCEALLFGASRAGKDATGLCLAGVSFQEIFTSPRSLVQLFVAVSDQR